MPGVRRAEIIKQSASDGRDDMSLSDYVHTFGRHVLRRYGERVHKIAIHAGFTCPNRDGSKGRGGCTFCNNVTFSPNVRQVPDIPAQIAAGRSVIRKRTGAQRYIAYFQAYTNTYDTPERLDQLYRQALAEPDVVGLAIGTRPDCVSGAVLDLFAGYQDRGYEVWLELGLQSASDRTLQRVNRGHGFTEYRQAVKAARLRRLPVCTHLIVGLPGESHQHAMDSVHKVLDLGVDGLKVHPLHVVKGTRLVREWRRGEYRPLQMQEYVRTVAEIVRVAPPEVVFHRLTGTAAANVLLAPAWCAMKWPVLNGIERVLAGACTAPAPFPRTDGTTPLTVG